MVIFSCQKCRPFEERHSESSQVECLRHDLEDAVSREYPSRNGKLHDFERIEEFLVYVQVSYVSSNGFGQRSLCRWDLRILNYL
jgi:hypothetical protein